MEQIFQLRFPNGSEAKAVRVQRTSHLPAVLSALDLAIAAPTLVLVGGASGIRDETMTKLRALFHRVLAPLVQSLGARVVDGGTDAGIMQLMGQARQHTAGTFPLIGVAAAGTVILPHQPSPTDGAVPEPHHTHLLLVPGTMWGDESPWIARVATVLSQSQPSLTVLINGGKISWQDVSNSIRARRPVLVIEGSGRTADELAAALAGDRFNSRVTHMAESGLLQAVNLDLGIEGLTQKISHLLNLRSSH